MRALRFQVSISEKMRVTKKRLGTKEKVAFGDEFGTRG